MSNEAKPLNSKEGNIYFPNELDRYDNPTYNIKFYMVSNEDMIGRNYGSTNRRIIAQSGVTQDFGIDDLNIDSYPAPSRKNGTGVSTLISFTLTEPLGASLFNVLYDYSVELGIPNYRNALYFIELSFKGYATEVNGGGDADSGELSANKWIWPILITKVNTEVTGSGSTYQISAAVSGDKAYDNVDGTTKRAVSVEASTVGEALDAIALQLTEKQKEAKDNHVGVPDEWSFEYEGTIKDYPIVPSSKNTSSSKMGTFSQESPKGKTRIQFAVGTALTDIVESVVFNTEQFQKKAKSSGKADGKDKQKEKDKAKLPMLPRVYSEITLGKYDYARGTYSKRISYYLKEYETAELAQELQDIKKDSQSKLNKIVSAGRIKKRYDYIFTGLNDQVLDMDLDFNFAYFQNVPVNAKDSNPDAQSQNAATTKQDDSSKKDKADAENNGAETAESANKDGGSKTGQGSIAEGTDNPNANKQGVEDKFGSGKNILTSLFNQAVGGDMITLDLDIKGDPYWLEPKPYIKNEGFVTNATSETTNTTKFSLKAKIEAEKNVANDFSFTKDGDLFILFNCGLPSYDQIDISGKPINQYNALSGIYRVISVKNTFENGKFEQKLELARVNGIDVEQTNIRKNRVNL